MDYKVPEKQRSKKDKAREKHDRNGGFSSKHIRIAEAAEESRAGKPKEKPPKKK